MASGARNGGVGPTLSHWPSFRPCSLENSIAARASPARSGSLPALQGPVTRSCTIPTGKALFFPIITYLNDYPCPDPNFQPPPGQTLEEFLTEGAAAVIDAVTQLEVVVDGQPLNEVFSYRAASRLFTFTADPSLVAFDPCVTGTSQFGVTDGYWILLNPLPPGPHTIFFRGLIDSGGGNTFEVQVTYNLTVTPM